MAALTDWIDKKNGEIRAGLGSLVRTELLEKTKQTVIPRANVPAVAALCRRTGIYFSSIHLLHRYVRPAARSSIQPTPEEILEYAGSLAQVGAEQEAIELLKQISPTRYPQADLFRAFAHFSRWEYAQAIPILERYTSSSLLEPYAKLIGKVNLTAALVFTRQDFAQNIIEEGIAQTEAYPVLRGNFLEISAQSKIFNRDFSGAFQDLEKSSQLLKSAGTVDLFFVEKWKAILKSIETSGNVSALREIRVRAVERSHWETVRECDFYIGMSTQDEGLLRHCYFGTPFPEYRARLVRETGLQPGDGYDWQPPEFSSRRKSGGDLHLNDISEGFKPGSVVQRLLQVLASDFYKPCHLISLHAQVFPDRFLNPRSSATTVHQIIKRARQWLIEKHPGIEIQENLSRYSLRAHHGIRIHVGLHGSKTRNDYYWDLLPQNGRFR